MTKVGDLVKCHAHTRYPLAIGQIVEIQYLTEVGDCGDTWNREYLILVNGDISNFIPGDFEVIDEKAKAKEKV